MSERPRVTFDHVWKKFQRGERHDSLRDLIPAMVRRLGRQPKPSELEQQEFWALSNVSFEVRPGEALGIIGPNGAGKSTVLKTLTKILRPTLGACEIRGRAGALIEVAAGFHPELTGIENVYLQGAIMGMKRAEIAERLDAILDFAAVGPFVDTPVKRYSSGMNARLGFSIAAHLSPDVLIIDEVLSVGDMAFQEKCERRMLEFKRSGVAVVFVSHNLAAVERLCERTLLLDHGTPVALGPSQEVITRYLNATAHTQDPSALGCSLRASFGDDNAQTADTRHRPGQRIQFDVELTFHTSTRAAAIGFSVWSFRTGTYAYEANSHQAGLDPLAAKAGDRHTVTLEFDLHLARGLYRVDLVVFEPSTRNVLGRQTGALVLTVTEHSTQNGVANLYLRVKPTKEAAKAPDGTRAHGARADAVSPSNPLVSVVLPTFNGAPFVAEAIDSVLAQTYKPIEIIVVDDGSTDETPAVLASYGSAITVIPQSNQGVSAARNRAIGAAHGEYVALIDHDDRWDPGKIERQVEVLKTQPQSVLVHTGRRVIDEAGRVIRQMDLPPVQDRCLLALVRRNTITASSVLVRRAALDSNPFPLDVPGCDDWDLWLRLAAYHDIAYVAAPLTDYRIHGSNASRDLRPMLRGSIGVLSRLLRSANDQAVVTEASVQRHRLQMALAHHEYDTGQYARARKAFHKAGWPFGRADLIRLGVCYLPTSLIRALKSTPHAFARSEPNRAK